MNMNNNNNSTANNNLNNPAANCNNNNHNTLNNNNPNVINQNSVLSAGSMSPMGGDDGGSVIVGEDGIIRDQPDPDYIKMFVGQVPRSMDEQQLKEMFEEFGRVHQINVLRDKASGLSKGI